MEPQPRRLRDSAPACPGTRHDWPPRALRPSKKQSPTAFRRLVEYLRQMWSNGILIQAVGIPLRHLLAFYGLRLCLGGQVPWRTGLFAMALWPISGFGVTAGAHRLWTHQSYVASRTMEAMLMLMFSMADQGPIQGWALTHAMHHIASDTRWDPHNRTAGFWYAHVGWLFSSMKFRLGTREYRRVVERLGPVVKFHDACSLWWDPLWSHAVPAAVATLWGDFRGGLFVAGALRWMIVQHITFAVNSLAHGEQEEENPYAFDPTAFGIGPRVPQWVLRSMSVRKAGSGRPGGKLPEDVLRVAEGVLRQQLQFGTEITVPAVAALLETCIDVWNEEVEKLQADGNSVGPWRRNLRLPPRH
eukprot:s5234_g8.t1